MSACCEQRGEAIGDEMNILDDEDLYHCTYSGRLPNIVRHGLIPDQEIGLTPKSLDQHRKSGIFLTTDQGVKFWFGGLVDWVKEHRRDDSFKEGLAPVVLRVSASQLQRRVDGQKSKREIIEKCKVDELGTRDARHLAFKCNVNIPARMLEVWTGSEWEPVSSAKLDEESAYYRLEDRYYLQPYYSNPFYPKTIGEKKFVDLKFRNIDYGVAHSSSEKIKSTIKSIEIEIHTITHALREKWSHAKINKYEEKTLSPLMNSITSPEAVLKALRSPEIDDRLGNLTNEGRYEEAIGLIVRGLKKAQQLQENPAKKKAAKKKASKKSTSRKTSKRSSPMISKEDLGRRLAEFKLGSEIGQHSDFRGKVFENLYMKGAKAPDSDFRDSDISWADMTETTLDRSLFQGSTLFHTDFTKAKIRNSNFSGLDGSRAKFIKSKLKGSNFYKANAPGALFSGADMRGVDLRKSNLSIADFNGATFDKGTKIKGANMFEAFLDGVDFKGVDVSGVNFDGANLRKSKNLEKAINLSESKNIEAALLPESFSFENKAKAAKKKAAKKKTTKKKATRAKCPPAATLVKKCRKLWESYCERPSKTRLKTVFEHLDLMKQSKAKSCKEERARCLRAANKEAKRLGMK